MCHGVANLYASRVSTGPGVELAGRRGRVWGAVYLYLEEVLGRAVQLLEGLLARIGQRLHREGCVRRCYMARRCGRELSLDLWRGDGGARPRRKLGSVPITWTEAPCTAAYVKLMEAMMLLINSSLQTLLLIMKCTDDNCALQISLPHIM